MDNSVGEPLLLDQHNLSDTAISYFDLGTPSSDMASDALGFVSLTGEGRKDTEQYYMRIPHMRFKDSKLTKNNRFLENRYTHKATYFAVILLFVTILLKNNLYCKFYICLCMRYNVYRNI